MNPRLGVLIVETNRQNVGLSSLAAIYGPGLQGAQTTPSTLTNAGRDALDFSEPGPRPPPPPVAVSRVPQVGQVAPRDGDRKLQFGAMANRQAHTLTCIAVSHASPQATRKWIDLLGGPWNVRVVVDQDRAVYAAWGVCLTGLWHVDRCWEIEAGAFAVDGRGVDGP